MPFPYHVVKYSVNGKFKTYKIYKNNKVYLQPKYPQVLGKVAAYAICRLLNYGEL